MQKITIIVTILTSACLLAACDNDNDDNTSVDISVREAFSARYPDANLSEWERSNAYYVAEFRIGQIEKEAWYKSNADWVLTETDLTFSQLPETVSSAFNASEYANWLIDDVHMLERPTTETLYVVEAEQGNIEYKLYFSEQGEFIKTGSKSDEEEYLCAYLSQTVLDFINEHYSQSTILDAETENGKLEIKIRDAGTIRELTFSDLDAWLKTSTEVPLSELPVQVSTAFSNSAYSTLGINNIDAVETTDGVYYLFELVENDQDIHIRITTDGTITRI